jgi:RHH-type proline utilization regulon transcriptional repressor/proline dehydrogenase/delta 1-pyrroline-5-carboxylate dehydrogenase
VPLEQLLRNPATNRSKDEDVRMNTSSHHPHNGARPGPVAKPEPAYLEFFHEEPLSDFSRADVRAAMQTALGDVNKQLGRNYAPIVGGKVVTTTTTLDSVDPSQCAIVVGRVGTASPAQARDAVALAKAAFPAWRDTAVEKRAECLRAAARIMRRRRFELSAWIIRECGKPWREADGDVAEAIDFCDYYAQEMLKLARPRLRNVAGEDNAYFYEPRGVAVIIAPWNFPLAILCGMTAAALVTADGGLARGRCAARRHPLPAGRRRGDRSYSGGSPRRRAYCLYRICQCWLVHQSSGR